MVDNTRGIVLNKLNYAESSIIVRVLTEQNGLQSYLIAGVRKKKSRNKSALFQPLSLLEIVAHHKENGNLVRPKEIKIETPYSSIPFDLVKNSITLFLAEVLSKSLQMSEQDERLFKFIHNSMMILDHLEEGVANFHLVFLVKLSRFLGFGPTGDGTRFFDLINGQFSDQRPLMGAYIDGEQVPLLQEISGTNFDELDTLLLNRNKRQLILDTLIKYYSTHIETIKKITAHNVLETVID